jgi:hypothetical protein
MNNHVQFLVVGLLLSLLVLWYSNLCYSKSNIYITLENVWSLILVIIYTIKLFLLFITQISTDNDNDDNYSITKNILINNVWKWLLLFLYAQSFIYIVRHPCHAKFKMNLYFYYFLIISIIIRIIHILKLIISVPG